MTTTLPKSPTPEKLAALGSLTAGLVHELRNPLNAIRANLQLLEEDTERNEGGEGPQTRRVRRILREVDRLDTILTDFLAFVREPKLQPRPFDLADLLQEIVTLLTPQADAEGVTILSELKEEILISGDRESLKQALMNLAVNALQAMEGSSSGTLMIRLSSHPTHADCVLIQMTDTGRGIPPDVLPRIFEPFFTTRDEGTGIGLSVVKRIIEAHGGSLHCESEPGRGTSFSITIPRTRISERTDG